MIELPPEFQCTGVINPDGHPEHDGTCPAHDTATFSVEWADEVAAWVYGVNGIRRLKLGALNFADAAWWFTPQDGTGHAIFMQVEDKRRLALVSEQQALAVGVEGPTLDALTAELNGRIDTFRDDTREAAVFMAKVKAKKLLTAAAEAAVHHDPPA